MFYIPVELRRCFFWALAGRFGNSWPCQKPPNHLLRETKGRNRISNEPFEHHVKLFKRRKPFTGLLIKNMFIMTRHGKWAQTKEKKIIVLYIKYGRRMYSFSLSKKGRVDMCVNIHTCDTAVFFHSFYNTATQSHCAGMTRDLCTLYCMQMQNIIIIATLNMLDLKLCNKLVNLTIGA